jgi:hypothetical protein
MPTRTRPFQSKISKRARIVLIFRTWDRLFIRTFDQSPISGLARNFLSLLDMSLVLVVNWSGRVMSGMVGFLIGMVGSAFQR